MSPLNLILLLATIESLNEGLVILVVVEIYFIQEIRIGGWLKDNSPLKLILIVVSIDPKALAGHCFKHFVIDYLL